MTTATLMVLARQLERHDLGGIARLDSALPAGDDGDILLAIKDIADRVAASGGQSVLPDDFTGGEIIGAQLRDRRQSRSGNAGPAAGRAR